MTKKYRRQASKSTTIIDINVDYVFSCVLYLLWSEKGRLKLSDLHTA